MRQLQLKLVVGVQSDAANAVGALLLDPRQQHDEFPACVRPNVVLSSRSAHPIDDMQSFERYTQQTRQAKR